MAESETKSSTLAKHGNSSVRALCCPKVCCHYRYLPLKGGKNMRRSKASYTTETLFLQKMSNVSVINYLKALNSAH